HRENFSPSSVLSVSSVAKSGESTQAQIIEGYGRLPLAFEANHGQTDSQVKFISRGSGYSLFLTATEVVLALKPKKEKTNGTALRMQLVGSNPKPRVSGIEELPGKSNYFIGND